MNEHTAAPMRRPRTDTRLLDDITLGLSGYWAVLVAHDLKLFPLLAANPCTLPEVCDRLPLARRPAEALLIVCVSLGLIQVHDGHYGLTPLAEDHLLDSSPTYFGGLLDLWITNASLLSFESVKRVLLTDASQPYGEGEMFQSHAAQADLARAFTWAMHSNSMGPALVWPDTLDLSGHTLMLDVGGGSGAHCIGATRRWPHFLTLKSFASLAPGGRIILHERLLNDEKTGPFAIAALSVAMLLWTEGEQYSGRELSAMLAEAGFIDIEVKPTWGYWSIVTGRKP
jgi:hypothetical protein